MSRREDPSGPQFRADRPGEQEAVRTTIVGGRPPGSGQSLGEIPRGIEVLVKKASVDPEFKALLLEKRADSAAHIGLVLNPSETTMLNAVPESQLEAIIAQTHVPPQQRRVFLGKAATAMLAAAGVVVVASALSLGSRPGKRPERKPHEDEDATSDPVSRGTRPDEVPVTKGIRPDKIPAPTGSRPDLPPTPPGATPPEAAPP